MRTLGTTLSTVALVLALATAGHAAVLWTAPAASGYPTPFGRTLFCDIRYVGNGTGTVTIDIFNYAGNVLRSAGPRPSPPTRALPSRTSATTARRAGSRCRAARKSGAAWPCTTTAPITRWRSRPSERIQTVKAAVRGRLRRARTAMGRRGRSCAPAKRLPSTLRRAGA